MFEKCKTGAGMSTDRMRLEKNSEQNLCYVLHVFFSRVFI